MCSQYWTLYAKVTCPDCKQTATWDLQTHFMGDFGSCINYYKLGESITELENLSITLDGKNDDFIGHCKNCGKLFDLGAKIVKGKVKRVWILRETKIQTPSYL